MIGSRAKSYTFTYTVVLMIFGEASQRNQYLPLVPIGLYHLEIRPLSVNVGCILYTLRENSVQLRKDFGDTAFFTFGTGYVDLWQKFFLPVCPYVISHTLTK